MYGIKRLWICLGFGVAAAWLLASGHAAHAQVPETILIRGQLLDSEGAPIVGLRQYRVRFFDAETEGAQLGNDITDVTQVNAQGLFAIPLLPPAAVLDAPAAWYELALDSGTPPLGVGPEDIFPQRVRVHSVPFARIAGEALSIEVGAIGNGSVSLEEFNGLVGLSGNVQTQLDGKAVSSQVYTQAEIDAQQAAVDDAIAEVEDKLFQWQVVTEGPVQMQANRGYVINSASPVSLALPLSESLNVGDVVRISGMGAGGWNLGQQESQQILAHSLLTVDFQTAWTPRDASRQWTAVASSADGMKLAAATSGSTIFTSTDAGATWTARDESRGWRAIASSADGTRLVAAVFQGRLYTSDDSGLNWTPREVSRQWNAVASSADGLKLAAVALGEQIYTSINGGISWTPRESARSWHGVASSADGVKLVATVRLGHIYTSDDSGVTWNPNDIERDWWPVASSADGTRLLAGVEVGLLYTSTDSGATWTPHENIRQWRSVASSANGNRLAAAAINNRIYTSDDGGASWTARENLRSWQAIASSADGQRLIAGALNSQLFTSPTSLTLFGKPTTSGGDGGLIGPQHSAVELQYIGGGEFMPLSVMGSLEVQ